MVNYRQEFLVQWFYRSPFSQLVLNDDTYSTLGDVLSVTNFQKCTAHIFKVMFLLTINLLLLRPSNDSMFFF